MRVSEPASQDFRRKRVQCKQEPTKSDGAEVVHAFASQAWSCGGAVVIA